MNQPLVRAVWGVDEIGADFVVAADVAAGSDPAEIAEVTIATSDRDLLRPPRTAATVEVHVPDKPLSLIHI